MRLRCLIVCTRGSALLPPSLPPLSRPGAPWLVAPAGRAGERGTLGGWPRPEGRSLSGMPTPRLSLGQNLEKLRPQFAQRHSLSGAFSTPALTPAGAMERRGGLPSPLAPSSTLCGSERQSARCRGGGRASWGDPHRWDSASRLPQCQDGLGSSRAACF